MRYAANFDPRSFHLRDWARWVAAGRPVHFSVYGNSTSCKPFQARHSRTFITSKALWRDEGGENTSRLMKIDTALNGSLTAAERQLLLACVAPSPTGQPLPLVERAEALGVAPAVLRLVRRRALELIG